jgi:lipoyl(octanoyl) transferase
VISESVCVQVFRRKQGQIEYLMLRRSPKRGGFWQSVSGRVKKKETAESAARREVREETGLDPRSVILLEKVNVFFNVEDESMHLEPCFGAEVPDNEVVLSREHETKSWTDFDEAMRRTPFPGVRDALTELHGRLVRAGSSAPTARGQARDATADG